MAGVTVVRKAPYPTGKDSTVTVRLGGYVPQGETAMVVDNFVVPWDCFVMSARLSYTQIGAAELDAITLTTKDDTKTIVASQDPSADSDGTTAETLHSDVLGKAYTIQRGDAIITTADSSTANEEGIYFWTLELLPIHG